ncbi:uncharacterized protein LOC110041803 [Orbicella faveolata]|uniref:uncharacterized protein LOC110041803 n=1 Tax=Orbicella faveolata TaxID=48498 RepID=UPI0009E4B05A|nr:uncharacterized protein LOC110041803 [Orbicella faveolata]
MPPTTPRMMGYDVAVAMVNAAGVGTISDHLTDGTRAPPPDASQDWTLTYSSEYNGVTTLRFYRKLNTADEQGDVVIELGVPVYLIWAFHPTSDSIRNHLPPNRGFQEVTFVAGPTTGQLL